MVLDPDTILAVSHGRRGAETIAEFAPAGADLAREAEWLYAAEPTEREGIIPVRGAAALLAALPPQRITVVTSATRELTLLRLSLAPSRRRVRPVRPMVASGQGWHAFRRLSAGCMTPGDVS